VLQAICRQRLPPILCPRHFYDVPQFPTIASGKIDRELLIPDGPSLPQHLCLCRLRVGDGHQVRRLCLCLCLVHVSMTSRLCALSSLPCSLLSLGHLEEAQDMMVTHTMTLLNAPNLRARAAIRHTVRTFLHCPRRRRRRKRRARKRKATWSGAEHGGEGGAGVAGGAWSSLSRPAPQQR